MRQEIDAGGDPLAKIEAEREAPTVAELCDRFELEHLSRKRPSTAKDYRGMLRVWVRPHFGKHAKVAAVTFSDIDELHRKISEKAPYRANRCIAVLSKMFSLAVKWQMRSDNPCRGIERNVEHHRRRYLSADELGRLVGALKEHPDRQVADAVMLLLLSGARKGEVLSMKWEALDSRLASGVSRLARQSKTVITKCSFLHWPVKSSAASRATGTSSSPGSPRSSATGPGSSRPPKSPGSGFMTYVIRTRLSL